MRRMLALATISHCPAGYGSNEASGSNIDRTFVHVSRRRRWQKVMT